MKSPMPRVLGVRFALALLGFLALALADIHAIHAAPASDDRHELTQADADAWLDGFMPVALARGDIAGAVVVIVKDGQVLTQRGFGYADIAARKPVDPAKTLFRVGSTSKLFTWTAVLQLVEQGKINLDLDVNRYLDFKIPAFRDKPITLRNIMTHTPGFQDVVKGGITFSGKVDSLGDVVKRMLPQRIYAPGTTPAYSNYATALAGYVVERVSGMPFDTYIEREIFQPLGMTRSSFRQPLPESLAPLMARGYPRASEDPKPFELISVPPAGSLSMTGADAAKFMIAQLNHGAGLLQPATAELMQTPAYEAIPGLNRMALGFYEQRINDLEVIAHGGDLSFFHGYMWLFPQKNTGLLVEMNSAGEGAAAEVTRQMLFERFSDRYFPAANVASPAELSTAREHARMLVGNYISSRGAFTDFLDVGNFLGQVKVGLDREGRPLVPELFGGPPRQWLETAPFLWQDTLGHARLGATVENGRVVRWSFNEISPFQLYERAPWYRDTSWLMPAFVVSIAIVLIAALSWPIGAIARRCYGPAAAGRVTPAAPQVIPPAPRDTPAGQALKSNRRVPAFSWLVAAVIGGWTLVLTELGESVRIPDWLIWLLQILGALAFFGLLGAALWEVRLSWRAGRGWFAKSRRVLVAVAAFFVLWVAVSFHLISFGTSY